MKIWQLLIGAIPILGCQNPSADHGLTRYLNETSVSDFAPELWVEDNTYKSSFSDDYRTLYFFRKKSPGVEKYVPYQSLFEMGKWQEPTIMDHYDEQQSYTYQLNIPQKPHLVFLSDKRTKSDTSETPNYNFWIINESGDLNPKELGYQSLIYNYNSQPCISENGTIYFTSDEPDWSATHSYKMKPVGTGYGEPELFEPVNKWRDQNQHWIVYEFSMSPEENYMIICIENKSDPEPSTDLYLSKLDGTSWTEPEKLGHGINTAETENFPVITADGKFLIFTRAFSEFKIAPTATFLKSE